MLMAKSNPLVPTGPQLFQLCAAHPDNNEHWSEFIRRFNPLLARSIRVAWQRCGQGDWPPPDLMSDLLQDIYLSIVNHEFRLLRNFRGASDAEAEAYLAHVAINRAISFMRSRQALRRRADEVCLQELLEEEGSSEQVGRARSSGPSLTEGELLGILEKCFDGPNGKRDILIFLLHFRSGFSSSEIASLGVAELKETSIANLLGQMKTRLKKYLSD